MRHSICEPTWPSFIYCLFVSMSRVHFWIVLRTLVIVVYSILPLQVVVARG